LPDGCAIRGVAAGSGILDPDGDDITATKLAVDGQIKHGKVANSTLNLELRPNRTRYVWEAAAALAGKLALSRAGALQ
jgi:hypothetical protein